MGWRVDHHHGLWTRSEKLKRIMQSTTIPCGDIVKCPFCACQDTRVIDSRETPSDDAVRRRRQCVACEKRFTTYERFERPDLRVQKRNGRVEDWDRDKLEVGVIKACEKRPIAREAVTRLIDEIEETLRAEGALVPSTQIGALVLEGLRKLDEVAYVRFASVYRNFSDASHFEGAARELRQGTLDGGFAAPEAGKKVRQSVGRK
jgi:transcriptional repressor NrdR